MHRATRASLPRHKLVNDRCNTTGKAFTKGDLLRLLSTLVVGAEVRDEPASEVLRSDQACTMRSTR